MVPVAGRWPGRKLTAPGETRNESSVMSAKVTEPVAFAKPFLGPEEAEAANTPRTKVIMPVHQLGLPVDIDRFSALGRKHGLAILEDAACAIGSRYKGRPVGGHSEMACFSFHPRKVITTGEGGMITTN